MSEAMTQQSDPSATRRFLGFTRKYGWITVEPAPPKWSGYMTVPGKYGLKEADILAREDLPATPQT